MCDKKQIAIIAATIFLILATACNNADNEKIDIHRFDIAVQNFAKADSSERNLLKQEYAPVILLYVDKIYSGDSLDIDAKLDNFANSPAINFFRAAVDSAFSNTDNLAHALWDEKLLLENKFGIKYPTIYTAIIPYNQSILLNDSTAIIGLNHYLGRNYKPYEYFPEYKRYFKIPEKIPFDLCEAILKVNYPYEPKSNTLLENMIYEGLIVSAMEETVPEYNDSLCLSFKKQQLEWCIENEKLIWNQLMIDDILFSTSPIIKNSLLNPAPFSEPLSQESPGQAGRWIGYRIVEKYSNKTKADMVKLLKEKAYQQSQRILIDSEYDGQQ